MEEISEREAPFDPPRRRRPDIVSTMMLVITGLLLIGTAWLRFGPGPQPDPLDVGSESPSLGLTDLQSGEPIVLLGLRGKVVWLTFWTARDESVRRVMPRLNSAWKGLKGRPSFAMLTAMVDSDDPAVVRKAVAEDQLELPIYRATRETCQSFGVPMGELPLHVVLDTDGRVLAIVRGGGELAVSRVETVVRARLETFDPGAIPRFARMSQPRTDVVARERDR